LKGEPIKGYAQISIGGVAFRLEDSNKQEFLTRLWGAMGRGFATNQEPAAIVPIPNSAGIVGAPASYRTLLYAQEIAANSGGKLVAVDALRWKNAAGAVHKQAGFRSPGPRFENLTVIQKPDRPVVLFDDVITSGSSFIAAVWRLSEVESTPIEGVVIARRPPTQQPKMFESKQEELENTSQA
jgi:predicted amidophosphoribosyltransferase